MRLTHRSSVAPQGYIPGNEERRIEGGFESLAEGRRVGFHHSEHTTPHLLLGPVLAPTAAADLGSFLATLGDTSMSSFRI